MGTTRTEETHWVAKIERMMDDAVSYYKPRFTDFLDPRQQQLVHAQANHHGRVKVRMFGGFLSAERVRACFSLDSAQVTDEAFSLALLIIVPQRNMAMGLDHGDYLGAMLGIGIKREKVGDLLVFADRAYAVVAEELVPLFRSAFTQVGSVPVTVDQADWDVVATYEPQVTKVTCSVASLRLDGVLSEVCHLSRTRVVLPIKAGRCKVNWQVVDSPAATLRIGDMVSMSGFGRFRLEATEGVTRSGRIRLHVAKYV